MTDPVVPGEDADLLDTVARAMCNDKAAFPCDRCARSARAALTAVKDTHVLVPKAVVGTGHRIVKMKGAGRSRSFVQPLPVATGANPVVEEFPVFRIVDEWTPDTEGTA